MSDDSLVKLAAQLRETAVQADRPDVAAKAEDIILLLGADRIPAAERRTDKADMVQRILNGLGF
ncbi:hypothetical protein [Actinoplanes sp. TFC3]|uniref:hypothetical protein n=1 Tax=Actinoplanes sp. TFC3 TaxID=1710355 RepID=UPI00082A1329|nr:hypothetical protein [Actinoplanes sp. TFC3]